jgi:hypothetical protein
MTIDASSFFCRPRNVAFATGFLRVALQAFPRKICQLTTLIRMRIVTRDTSQILALDVTFTFHESRQLIRAMRIFVVRVVRS